MVVFPAASNPTEKETQSHHDYQKQKNDQGYHTPHFKQVTDQLNSEVYLSILSSLPEQLYYNILKEYWTFFIKIQHLVTNGEVGS